MMKILLLSGLLCLISCSQSEPGVTDELKEDVINTDIAMSNLAVKEGFNSALLYYADTGFVKLGEGKHPIIGKAAFGASFDKSKDVKTITWNPAGADVAKSGELGYTWGNWKYDAADTTYYGNYFTVWKKLSDGSWKMALDGGNNTPNASQ